jgi:hypothetical protein
MEGRGLPKVFSDAAPFHFWRESPASSACEENRRPQREIDMANANTNVEVLLARLAAAEAKAAAAEAKAAAAEKAGQKPLKLKASEKGGVSVYGLMRFPVTLYPAAWLRLLALASEITAFIDDNSAELARRGAVSKAAKKTALAPIESLAAQLSARRTAEAIA